MEYALKDLDAQTLKGMFDAAFMDTDIDSDGDLVVRDGGLNSFVKPSPRQELIKVFALMRPEASAEELLVFCNKFNEELVMVRASVKTAANPPVVVFDYDLFVDETVDAKTIVQATQRFAKIIHGGISQLDDNDIF